MPGINRLPLLPALTILLLHALAAPGLPAVAQEARIGAVLDGYRPVTDQMLQQPPAADWLMWRNRYDASGHSDLDQINRDNIAALAEAWSAPLSPGGNMTTPLVHDGVLFIADTGNQLRALDARNGRELWQYTHESENFDGRRIGIALYGDKVIVPHNDLDIVALNVRTGAVEWESTIVTPVPEATSGYYALRSAPLVASGMVIQGVTATAVPQGGFIVGLDLDDGTEQWRFHTVARPGESGGDSWNNLPLERRSGGSVWVPGSYDADLNLVYFGTAPTYDTAPLMDDLGVNGVTNDALYTNTTLALRPTTGELVWYFQHMPNDQLDLDWVYERHIDELVIDGSRRKVVFTAGKMALYDVLDAATGEYLASLDLGVQNIIDAIDPDTGHKTLSPDAIPNAEASHLLCPYYLGGRNWQAGAYNPASKMLFLPMSEMCMMAGQISDGRLLTSRIEMEPMPRVGSDGSFGRLQAVNMATMELAWRYREVAPPSTATLSTGGGLVFGGSLDKVFKAFDAQSGDILWQTALGHIPSSFPITYAVDGKQYVAIVRGQPSRFTGSLFGTISSLLGSDHPVVSPPTAGPALVVFALP